MELFYLIGLVFGVRAEETTSELTDSEVINTTAPLFQPFGIVGLEGDKGHASFDIDVDVVLQQNAAVHNNVSLVLDKVSNRLQKESAKIVIESLRATCDVRMKKAQERILDIGVLLGMRFHVIDLDTATAIHHKTREKRMLNVVGGLIGLGGGILSLYNLRQLRELRAEVKRSSKVLHHQVKDNRQFITRNALAIASMNRALEEMAEEQREERLAYLVVLQIDTVVSLYEQAVNDLVAGIMMMTGHRLTPFLLESDVLSGIVDRVRIMAKNRGLELLEKDNQYETSFSATIEGHRIQLMLHFPVIDQRFHLFRFINIPQRIGNVFATVNDDAAYLAVAFGGSTMGMVMSEKELGKCAFHQVPQMHVCAGRQVQINVYETTCLGSLMEKRNNDKRLCKISYHRQVESVIQVDAERVIIIARSEEDKSRLQCGNQSRLDSVPVKHARLQRVPPGCQLLLPDSVYKVHRNFEYHSDYEYRYKSAVNLTVPEEHAGLLQQLLARISLVTSDDLAAAQRHEEDHEEHAQGVDFLVIIVFVLLGAVALLAIAYAISYCVYRQRLRRDAAGRQ